MRRQVLTLIATGVVMALAGTPALAQKTYGPGVTDTEIKLGQTMPYSGPASAYGTQGKSQIAYFKMVNDKGGINGRKVTLISLDDGYSPPKTLEQTRKLVEEEEVLALFSPLGTPTNSAIHRYVNAKKVPHIMANSGAAKWNDPKNFPWTMGWTPTYFAEGRIYGQYILKNIPNAKIAVLMQNDDFGKDYLNGLKDGLGDKAKQLIVAESTYETTDPTVDSQMVALKASGANVFMNIASPKFAALAIRKAHESGWKVPQFLASVSGQVASVLKPAGLEASTGIISTQYIKDPNDPQWASDAGTKWYLEFMKKYYPEGDPLDTNNVAGSAAAQVMEQILKQCGDNLSRENVMKQAANIKDFTAPMLLTGITLNTGPNDYNLFEQMQMSKFDGTRWVRFGDVVGGR